MCGHSLYAGGLLDLVQCLVANVKCNCVRRVGVAGWRARYLVVEGWRTNATSTGRNVGADGSQAEVLFVLGDDESRQDCAGEDK